MGIQIFSPVKKGVYELQAYIRVDDKVSTTRAHVILGAHFCGTGLGVRGLALRIQHPGLRSLGFEGLAVKFRGNDQLG